jgi:hypothetical protein
MLDEEHIDKLSEVFECFTHNDVGAGFCTCAFFSNCAILDNLLVFHAYLGMALFLDLRM